MARYMVNSTNEPVQTQESKQEVVPAVPQKPMEPVEANPYANMFAEWDLVPPQLVIRRIHRKK